MWRVVQSASFLLCCRVLLCVVCGVWCSWWKTKGQWGTVTHDSQHASNAAAHGRPGASTEFWTGGIICCLQCWVRNCRWKWNQRSRQPTVDQKEQHLVNHTHVWNVLSSLSFHCFKSFRSRPCFLHPVACMI